MTKPFVYAPILMGSDLAEGAYVSDPPNGRARSARALLGRNILRQPERNAIANFADLLLRVAVDAHTHGVKGGMKVERTIAPITELSVAECGERMGRTRQWFAAVSHSYVRCPHDFMQGECRSSAAMMGQLLVRGRA